MKKVLIGCGVIFILLAAILVGAGFYAARSFRQFTASVQSAQTELDAVGKAFPFKAPADGQLTEAQLTAWLKVRERLQAQDLAIMARLQKGGLLAVREMAHLMPEAIRNGARVLREAQMAPAEYGWITGQVMGALKSRAAQKDPKTAELAALIDEPAPQANAGRNRPGGFRMRDGNRTQFAPLAAEDAQPVLELLKKHDAEFRKVARLTLSDGPIADQGRRAQRAARNANRATTATVTTGTATRATSATLEKPSNSAWDQSKWTTATTR